jgi:hypothetical protein
VGAEAAASDGQAKRTQGFLELAYEGFGDFWGCGVDEAGAPAATGVGEEGELADDESFAGDVDQREVEAAFVILEDAHFGGLLSETSGVIDCVAVGDAEEYEQAAAYCADGLSVDDDQGPADSLDDGLQGASLAGGCL